MFQSVESMCNVVAESGHSGSDKLFSTLLSWADVHSPEALAYSEDKLLANIKTPFRRYYVNIGKCVGSDDKVWTLEMNAECKNPAIVLLHGFGAGLAFWALNLEPLATHHPVYAFDILGLSRSSRPKFSTDPLKIEQEFVASIERWREEMKIDRMVLVAHSWGAFLAASYALSFPHRLEHLILVDSWGFDDHPDMKNFPFWKLLVAYTVRLLEGCFSMVRALGPLGPWLIKNVRPDLLQKYEPVADPYVMCEYIYHCVNNSNPTGEIAFHRMTRVGPWPVHPIGERLLKGLDDDLPITFLYGANSWTSKLYGYIIKEQRIESYTDVKIIPQAGHHIYTDNPDEFHQAVMDACKVLRSKRKINFNQNA